jgi:mono/diheme cytochrome c family protein
VTALLRAGIYLFALGALLAVVAFIWIGSRGISARAEPGLVETALMQVVRRMAIPRAGRDRVNPVPATQEVVAVGMAHYANHCASCHANDGSGDTEMGRGLYPKPPDMRLAGTQSLSDGELFYIIENGVRLTGMPAWGTGTPESIEESWHLVHFIRHLPKLTPDELTRMESLNPRPPEEIRQEIEEERFLQGFDPSPATPGTAP